MVSCASVQLCSVNQRVVAAHIAEDSSSSRGADASSRGRPRPSCMLSRCFARSLTSKQPVCQSLHHSRPQMTTAALYDRTLMPGSQSRVTCSRQEPVKLTSSSLENYCCSAPVRAGILRLSLSEESGTSVGCWAGALTLAFFFTGCATEHPISDLWHVPAQA